MVRSRLRRSPAISLFALYAVVSAALMLILGLVLAANDRGAAAGVTRAEATLVAPAPPAATTATPSWITPRQAVGGPTYRTAVVAAREYALAQLRRLRAEERTRSANILHRTDLELVLGLIALYLVLGVLTAAVARRLRAETARRAYLALHDPVTGLPNRDAFTRTVAGTLAARRADQPVAIAILDLDRFKAINDTLGHAIGNAVLRELAERLRAASPPDAVARLGGDEFALVLVDGSTAGTALRRIREMLSAELTVAGLTLTVPASVGYALAPANGTDADLLLQRAEIAMYAAKDHSAGLERYRPELERHDAGSLALVGELRHAIEAGQLTLDYQPQLQLRSGRVVALEALVRWEHPALGRLAPGRFLPLAEQTDVIEALTAWVLRRALRDLGTVAPHRDGPRVAVNVSARSIGRGALADEVLAALSELDVTPERLIIEVTETAILAEPERAAEELGRLADAGVTISLDDFGTGQTSIGHLSSLPLRELKIDRSLVSDIDTAPTHAAIVRSLLQLGANLGLDVVAEGVETDSVRDELLAAGAECIQGYLISRPRPLPEIIDWLTDHTAAGASGGDGQPETSMVKLAR